MKISNFKLKFLLALLIIGGVLRFYNLNWDQGHMFHPDERNIANSVTKIHFFDQLNPGFFAYGGLPIYLYRATGDVLVQFTSDPSWVSDWGKINVIGRFFSALFSTLTIVPLFFLALKLFNQKVAILSAIFYTFTVSSIQTAHFGTTESFLTATVTLIALLSIYLYAKPKLTNYILCAIIVGLSVAAKIIALSFSIFPFIASLITIRTKDNFINNILLFLAFILIGSITSFIFSPYSFLSWDKFMESMRYESGVALGKLPVPYTLQFTNTLQYLFQIKNLFWQMGPVFFFSLLGAVLLLVKMIKEKDTKLFILLSFPIVYFLYVGSWHTKFIRYMTPLIPFFIIFASYALFLIQRKINRIGKLLIAGAVFATALWALAFFSIYTREQTRITASKWIYKNIPAGSKILGEHWDDGLPVSLSSHAPSIYSIEQLTIYDPDNESKINYYVDKLSNADYIVINSRRLYGTLINLPDKYPVTSRYYKLLFAEKLGYKKVAEFTSYPSLFGIEINDDSAEETFQVYDHPKVIIFKNVEYLEKDDYLKIFNL